MYFSNLNPKVISPLLLLILISFNIKAQDSIQKLSSISDIARYNDLPANQRIDSLRTLSLKLNKTDSDKAILIINDAIQLASDEHDSTRIIFSLITLGDINYSLNRFSDAIEAYQQALNIKLPLVSDSLVALIYENIALSSASLGKTSIAEKYLDLSVKLYDSLGLDSNMVDVYFYLGAKLHDVGEFSKALNYLEKARSLGKQLSDQKRLVDIYNSIGTLFYDLGSFKDALDYYLTSLEIAETINNEEGIAFALNNIGIVYYDLGNLEKALEYYQQSMEMDKKRDYDHGVASSYNNIGIIYSDWNQNELAIEYYNKAVDIYKNLNAYADLANSLNNIGESYADMNQFDQAITYLNESLELEKIYGNAHGLVQSYLALADLYFDQKKYNKALEYSNQANDIAKNKQLTQLELQVDETLYKVYKALNNTSKALYYQELWIKLKDSVYSQQFHAKIADLELKHEFAQKKKDRQLLESQRKEHNREMARQRMYLIIIFVLMLVFGILVFYDIRSKTRVNKKLATVNHELENQRDKLTQTLEQLSKSELKYKNLVQNAPTGILFMDRNGNILEVNQTMLKILGSPGEAETKKINCLEFAPLRQIGVVDDIKSCMESAKPIHKEYVYTSKWGKEVSLSVNMTPISAGSGAVSSLIMIAEDVSISKRAERLIQKSEEKYRMLVENSLQAMMIVQGGRIIFANSKLEELTHYRVGDLIKKGRSWLNMVIHPDDLRKSIKNVKDALDGKVDSAKNEYRIIRKDGKTRWIEALSSVVNYQDQRSMLIVAIDITDRKEAESFLIASGEKLKQANAMKDKFFSIIAHDLKNPFNSILGFSNLLFEAYDNIDDSQRKSFIKNICQSSESTFKLLQNLLDWSRTQTGNIEYNPQNIDINAIAAENMSVIKSSVYSKKIKINIEIPVGVTAFADENMIKTVVRNLLSNAIKFTNKGGSVLIKAASFNNEIIVSVIDSGVGISPENLSRLFRIDDQYKTKGTDDELGSGLGLILCKELVEKNNGKIWVESKIGEGSNFSFTLPVGK